MVIRLASKRKYCALREEITAPVEATGAILPWIGGVDYQGRVVGAGGKNALCEKVRSYCLTGRLDLYIIKGIYFQRYVSQMLIGWTGEFDRWWQNIEERQSRDLRSRQIAKIVGTQLDFLQTLGQMPEEDSLQIRRVSLSKKNLLWRISHPYREGIAIRLVVWFPQYDRDLALVVMGVDKSKVGDIFYDGVGNRSDNLIREYLQDE